MSEVGCIAAAAAQPYALLRVGYRQQTAIFAGIARECIRAFHQTFFCELCHTVCDNTVALHFRYHHAPQAICFLFPRATHD